MPQAPAWSTQAHGPSTGLGRRPGGGGGAGRVRALDANLAQLESISLSQLRTRRRKPSRRAPPPRDPTSSSSSSDAESDEETHTADDYVQTASDSALDTPAEDGFTSSVSQPSKGIRGMPQAQELAAVKLAKFVGKDVSEMFAGLEGTRKDKIEHSVGAHTGMADAVPAYVL